MRETYLTEPKAGKRTDMLEGVNPQLLEGAGEVTVTLSNTRLATLRESAAHLMEYPYGCAEQITSGLIPWILLGDLEPVMPQLADGAGDASVVIQKGLDRLFAMQTPGGGIAYWPGGGQSSLFASAYAAVACYLVGERENIQVPAGHDALLDFLSQQLRGDVRISLEYRALALFALSVSGRAEPAYHEELYQHRKELCGEARAWLAMAVLGANGSKKMIETLLDPKVASPDAVSWFGGPARERAVRLFAWSLYNPGSREVAKLVNELLAFRHNGHWGTTQNNAWALLALARYYTTSEKGSPDVNATLFAAGREFPIAFNAQTIATSHAFDFAPDRPLAAINLSGAKLFGESLFVVRPLVAKQPAQNRGYAVSRTYQKLGGGPDALHRRLCELGLTTLDHTPEYYGPGLTIGNGEVRLLELTNAYATLGRLGMHQPYRVLEKHHDRQNRQVCDARTCYLIADMLADNHARSASFGSRSYLAFDFPVACKTGTSSAYRDNWALGFTPEFSVGVWVGNMDGSPQNALGDLATCATTASRSRIISPGTTLAFRHRRLDRHPMARRTPPHTAVSQARRVIRHFRSLE